MVLWVVTSTSTLNRSSGTACFLTASAARVQQGVGAIRLLGREDLLKLERDKVAHCEQSFRVCRWQWSRFREAFAVVSSARWRIPLLWLLVYFMRMREVSWRCRWGHSLVSEWPCLPQVLQARWRGLLWDASNLLRRLLRRSQGRSFRIGATRELSRPWRQGRALRFIRPSSIVGPLRRRRRCLFVLLGWHSWWLNCVHLNKSKSNIILVQVSFRWFRFFVFNFKFKFNKNGTAFK